MFHCLIANNLTTYILVLILKNDLQHNVGVRVVLSFSRFRRGSPPDQTHMVKGGVTILYPYLRL